MANELAQALNRDCYCIGVNREALHDSLQAHLARAGLPKQLMDSNSHLFADSPAFLGQQHLQEMERLIGAVEVNTNAAGVLLNLYLAAAQQACCDELITFFGGKTNFAAAENEIVAMFRTEWSSQMADAPLRTIAIVDSEPSAQFLYPEFLLFQSLFERHGIETVIADRNDYALYSDKRNLPLLSDADRLTDLGVEADVIAALHHSLPAAVAVTQDNAAHLWSTRKQYFFKPATGHGSRGVYRGAKLTKRVWEDIIRGDYIAQVMVPPSERQLIIDGAKQSLKLDIRCVTYGGRIQQLSARLYQGQATNLRTAGGGLATVFPTPDGSCFCQ